MKQGAATRGKTPGHSTSPRPRRPPARHRAAGPRRRNSPGLRPVRTRPARVLRPADRHGRTSAGACVLTASNQCRPRTRRLVPRTVHWRFAIKPRLADHRDRTIVDGHEPRSGSCTRMRFLVRVRSDCGGYTHRIESAADPGEGKRGRSSPATHSEQQRLRVSHGNSHGPPRKRS